MGEANIVDSIGFCIIFPTGIIECRADQLSVDNRLVRLCLSAHPRNLKTSHCILKADVTPAFQHFLSGKGAVYFLSQFYWAIKGIGI